mgnify:CR=1 FL=1
MATITLTMRHTRHEGTGLSTDTKPSANYDDRIYETDTGDEYKCFGGSNWVRISTGGAAHVVPKAEQGIVQETEISNPLSGARQTFYFIGAVSVYASFEDRGSAVAKEARLVFNAVDNTDADARAVTIGQRKVLKLGRDETYPASIDYPIIRVDAYSDVAAETGASKLILRGVSP